MKARSTVEFAALMPLCLLAIVAFILIWSFIQPAYSDLVWKMQAEQNASQIDVLLDVYVRDSSHGKERHADVYEEVVDACKNPHYQLWARPTKRIDVCFIEGLGFGFQIWKQVGNSKVEKVWSEITAYVREELVTFEDLRRFAETNNLILKEYINGQWVEIFHP